MSHSNENTLDTGTLQEFVDAVNSAVRTQKQILHFQETHKTSLSRADLVLLDTIFALNKQAFDLLFKVGRI